MFDKLIESNSEEAEFKNRRSYFVVSTIVVGVLFLAAVVASIYAGNIGIGNGDLEMTDLLAPVEMAAIEPEHPEPAHAQPQNAQSTETSRNSDMSRTDEPDFVPSATSTVPNTGRARPNFDFQISDGPETDSGNPGGTGRDLIPGQPGTGLADTKPNAEDPKPEKDPPPAIKAPKVIQSIGVVNGIAKTLPKPAYPATALALNIQGKVDVQVMIDETGKVTSAKAVSGHPLLRAASEKAAWSAVFTPTLLSKVPVKVTGVIVYNFTKN